MSLNILTHRLMQVKLTNFASLARSFIEVSHLIFMDVSQTNCCIALTSRDKFQSVRNYLLERLGKCEISFCLLLSTDYNNLVTQK